jgi:hypothetical protein
MASTFVQRQRTNLGASPAHVLLLGGLALATLAGSGCSGGTLAANAPGANVAPAGWLGIPSAINYIVNGLHEGTGWLLNKSQVSIKKVGEVRTLESESDAWEADFQIAVEFGNESFETTAKSVPCDQDGIPTEASVDRLKNSVEEIKAKMKRLQN